MGSFLSPLGSLQYSLLFIVLASFPREEVGSLEARISEAKDRYQKMVLSAKDGSKTMSALPLFQVNDKFVLSQDEAWYTLSIEVQVPIDTVLLQVAVLHVTSLRLTLGHIIL